MLIGATTENPFFSLTGPLLSRSTLFRLEPLSHDDLRTLLLRALDDADRGLGDEHLDDRRRRARAPRRPLRGRRPSRAHRRSRSRPRSRPKRAATSITLGDTEAALALRALRYGDDEHYDVLSAFIKSIRGSDVDAGLYWLARMLEAGEDPRLIAPPARDPRVGGRRHGRPARRSSSPTPRRARSSSSGMPEAQLNLAHAVMYLATAPKSNSATTALWAAQSAIRDEPTGSGPSASPGLQLPWRGETRARRGVRVPARRARRAGWTSSTGPTSSDERYWRPSGRGADVDRRPGHGTRRRRRSMSGDAMSGSEWRRDHRRAGLPGGAGGARRDDRAPRPHAARAARRGRASSARESAAASRELRAARPRRRVRARPGRRHRHAAPSASATGSTPRRRSPTARVTNPVVKAMAVGTGTRRAVAASCTRRRAGQRQSNEAS